MIEIEDLIEALFTLGASAWPEVQLDQETFATHLAHHATWFDPCKLGRISASDLYLAFACAASNARAIAAFEMHIMREIDPVLRRMRLTIDERAGVLKRLRHRLFAKDGRRAPGIGDFSGESSLRGWAIAAAVRIALGVIRERANEEKLEVLERRYGGAFKEALKVVVPELSEDDKRLIKQHYIDRSSPEENQSTVFLRLGAISDRIAKETRDHMIRRLNAEGPEVDSIIRLVRGRIEISFGVLVA